MNLNNDKNKIPLEEIQKIILAENREQAILEMAQRYATTFVSILGQLKELLGDDEYQVYIGNAIKDIDTPIIEFNPVEFYSKYINKITCAYLENVYQDKTGSYRCNAKRTEEKEKYIFKGLTNEVVLIECPKDILAIEFEVHNNKSKEDYSEVSKDKIKEWIALTVKKLKEESIDYCICDHGGTSPWIYICNIKGLVENLEKDCKESLARLLIPEEAFDFMDKSNFGATLIPIIERPHWKSKKYNNAIHKIIEGKSPSLHKNDFPVSLMEDIIHINRPRTTITYEKFDSDSNSNINDLSITSIVNMSGLKKRGHEYQGSNPWHGSSTGMNFTVEPFKNVAFCFRCNSGINPAQAIALNEGIISSCDSKMSKDQFFQVLDIASQKYGLKRKMASVLYQSVNEDDLLKKVLKPQKEDLDFDKLKESVCNIMSEDNDELLGEKRRKISELIANSLIRSYYIYTLKQDKGEEVWIYKDGIYVPNGISEIKQIIRLILQSHYSENYVDNIISRVEVETFIEPNQFFNNKILELIPVQNGLLNLFTRALLPFDPNKIFFNKLNVYYNPNAKCPAIENHLSEVLKHPDDKDLFFEVVGYCLWKDYNIERAIMMIGDGRNGKGKSIELIKRFLGLDNCASVSLTSIKEGNFSLSNLFGKMVNLAGDISSTSLKETGLFKQTTGRDLISANRKYLNDIQFTNYAKHIFACNELPMIFDNSKGFWERWIIFEFPYTFIHKKEYDSLNPDERKMKKIMDIDLIEKISTQEELNGLLNRALDGLQNLLERKDFCKTQGSEEVKRLWIRKANSFMAFCLDHLQEDSQSMVVKMDLRKAFAEYCREHRIKGTSDNVIKITLNEMFCAIEDQFSVPDSGLKYVWTGVSFKEKSKFKGYNYQAWKNIFNSNYRDYKKV